MNGSLFTYLHDRIFEALNAVDEWSHGRWFHPKLLCRLVGKMEPAYYERGIDWAHPIYEKPTGKWTPENRRRANANLLKNFLAVWDRVPDHRFGQFVMNLSRTEEGFADTWEWSHQRWLDELGKAAETWAGSE